MDAGAARGEEAVQEAVRRAVGLEHLDQAAARERELPEAEAQAGARGEGAPPSSPTSQGIASAARATPIAT